jgi:ECF transporter S component (folate family)
MSKSKRIVDLAIFIAIGIVLNLATLPSVTFFGRVCFVYCFCYLSGVFLGPVFGFIAAIAADGLGFLLQPTGPFVWQVMATNGLMALASGIFYKALKWKVKELRIIPAAVICYFFLTIGLGAWGESVYLFHIYPYTFAKSLGVSLGIHSPFLMISLSKAITQPFWIALNLIISIVVIKRISIAKSQFLSSVEAFKAEVSGSKKEKE